MHGLPASETEDPQEQLACTETNPNCPYETYYRFSSDTEKDLFQTLNSTNKVLTVPRSLITDSNIIDTEGDIEAIRIEDIEPIMPPREGTRTVIVVLVKDTVGNSPSMSENEASDRIFGTNGDTSNLVDLYTNCSNNKLKFMPGEGTDVHNGVITITVNKNLGTLTIDQMDAEVKALLPGDIYSGQGLDHTMMVFPISTGQSFGGAAAWVSVQRIEL
jgi:hypothetical protein